jgi:hypothetical protein
MQETTQTESTIVPTRTDDETGAALLAADENGPVFEDDVLVPRYVVVQPTSKEGTPGTFRSNLDGSERTELRLTPLSIRRGRVLWSAEIGTDPICRSDNGLDPSPTVEHPVAEACCIVAGRRLRPICPKAQWPRQGRPECRDTFLLVALDLVTGTPFAMSFHGSAIRTIKIIRTLAWQRRVALHDLECVLKLRRETSAKGNYFLPVVTAVTPSIPAGKHRAWFERFARLDVPAQVEDSNGSGRAGDERI